MDIMVILQYKVLLSKDTHNNEYNIIRNCISYTFLHESHKFAMIILAAFDRNVDDFEIKIVPLILHVSIIKSLLQHFKTGLHTNVNGDYARYCASLSCNASYKSDFIPALIKKRI